ncbi:MAG: UbiA family prenyltransferase [Hymenobacter sp.]
MTKARAYFQLLKFRLSITVAFSSALGYLLGLPAPNWGRALLVLLGGLLVTGAANIINQIFEKDLDKLMKRTENRPIPTGRITPNEAWVFCVVLAVAGLGLLAYYFNPLTAALSLLSLILYGFIYTPLKTVSPVCVAVGAIPGGLPPHWLGSGYGLRRRGRVGAVRHSVHVAVSALLGHCLGGRRRLQARRLQDAAYPRPPRPTHGLSNNDLHGAADSGVITAAGAGYFGARVGGHCAGVRHPLHAAYGAAHAHAGPQGGTQHHVRLFSVLAHRTNCAAFR